VRDGIEPTTLYPLRHAVHSENESKLQSLDPSSRQTFYAHDTVELHENAKPWVTRDTMLKDSFFLKAPKDGETLPQPGDCQAPKEMELRIGAQVMLLKNEVQNTSDDGWGPANLQICGAGQRLVNGSRGVVIAWDWALPKKDKENSDKEEDRHLAAAEMREGCASGCGGTAASSCEYGLCSACFHCSSEGAEVCAKAHSIVAAQRRGESDYQIEPPHTPTEPPPPGALKGRDGQPQLFPVVRFIGIGGRPRVKLILPEAFEKHVYLQGTCTRKQVPLALAWALTIHKAQGASLDYMCTDLKGCFAVCQAYVAISRATSVDGLEIRNFSPVNVKSSDLVRDFYDAVDKGQHHAFVSEPGMWWGEPILHHPLTRWKSLYMRHCTFRAWAAAIDRDAVVAAAHTVHGAGGSAVARGGGGQGGGSYQCMHGGEGGGEWLGGVVSGKGRDAKERLAVLRELFDDGLIDKDEFEAKRAAIIASI